MGYLKELSGRVALVTGASSGIGEATARHLCRLGMCVGLVARRQERLGRLVADLGANRALAIPGDVTDPDLAVSALTAAGERFGRIDAVVNNAGAFAVGPVEALAGDRVANLARTNVEGAYRIAFEAIKRFKAQGSGDLVNLSSISGTKVPRAGIGWYAGTKHALEALTESLRMECAGTGVRVSCIEPGMTQTEIFAEPITSIPRALDPDDVAQMIAFVLAVPDHVVIPRLMVLPGCQAI
jgi:NADP-dependent 3-hydroxy acid dehydrogenase YdfG